MQVQCNRLQSTLAGREAGREGGKMAVQLNRLTARQAQTLTEAGRHCDGGGLYLSISKTGASPGSLSGRRTAASVRWD